MPEPASGFGFVSPLTRCPGCFGMVDLNGEHAVDSRNRPWHVQCAQVVITAQRGHKTQSAQRLSAALVGIGR